MKKSSKKIKKSSVEEAWTAQAFGPSTGGELAASKITAAAKGAVTAAAPTVTPTAAATTPTAVTTAATTGGWLSGLATVAAGMVGVYLLYKLIKKLWQWKKTRKIKSAPAVIDTFGRAKSSNFIDIPPQDVKTISGDSYYSFMLAVSLRGKRQQVPHELYSSIAKDPYVAYTFAETLKFKDVPPVIYESIMKSEYASKIKKPMSISTESVNPTLNKLNKAYKIMVEHYGHCEENAQDLVEFFNNYGQKFKNSYFNSSFDNDGKNGIVVIKYSKCPMTENTSNEQLSKAPLNFIITVEGFNADGSVKSPLKVETINYYDSNKKARKIPVTGFEGLKATKDYLISYFEKYDRELMNEDGEGGAGATGAGPGTSSGATSSAEGGASRTVGDIAVFAKRMPMGITRRQWKKKKKK